MGIEPASKRTMKGGSVPGGMNDVALNAMAVTDAFLVFAMGLIVMQRVEMYIRARRIQAGGTDSHVEVVA